MTAYERRQSRNFSGSTMRLARISDVTQDFTGNSENSPTRFDRLRATAQPSLLDQAMLEEVVVADVSFDEVEVERQLMEASICVQPGSRGAAKLFGGVDKGGVVSKARGVLGDKENILP
jgi:centromeric protein E